MGGIIDFDTTCPWELYLFSFAHLAGGVFMYLFDSCRLLFSTPCTDTELVFGNLTALSMLYVGVIFTVIAYHSKRVSAAHVTSLSNMALNCAVALLVCVVFAGNASFGGIERSWMHMCDVLTGIILVGVLTARVAKIGVEWAQMKPLNEGMGINCKTLLVLFLALTLLKFVAYTDFIDPLKILADGMEMTEFATWMWRFVAVLLFEIFLAILYSVLFDDEAGHELLVIAIMIMTLVGGVSIYPIKKYMSDWMGMNNTHALWIWVGVFVLICIVAIVGGRRGRSHDRSGYLSV